jgi:hypothetical protein
MAVENFFELSFAIPMRCFQKGLKVIISGKIAEDFLERVAIFERIIL